MRTIQLFSALSLLLSAAFLCSCNSDQSTSKEITLSNVKIMGEDNQYIEVVPGLYTLNFEKDDNDYNTSITLNLRLVKKVGELKNKEARYGNIAVALLDNDDQRVDINNLSPIDGGWDKIADLLKSEVGSVIKVRFSPFGWGVDGEKCKEFDKITNIELVEADFGVATTVDYSSSNSQGSSTSSNTNDSPSDDWDSLLDSYESYMEDCIKLLKKAQAGDASAMTQYVSMLEKAQDLQSKLTSAQGALSPTQAAKFSKIMNKMASAAASM